MFRKTLAPAAIVLLTLGVLAACSNYRGYRAAQLAETAGDWDAAVLKYMQLVTHDPKNLGYRTALLRAKIQASNQHFERAKQYQQAGILRQAMIELQQAAQLDPTNQYAQVELDKVRIALEAERNGGASTIEEMKRQSRGALAQPPVLNPRSDEPIDLDFGEPPASIMKIYQALGTAFGINVLFDPKLRDSEISIRLRDVTALEALEILMRTAGHFYKVLDEHSIIIVADTPQNRRTYEDLIIQTFFLSNSEVKDVMTMLRSLVDARKIAANEQLNAIILRDTADKVKVAERIILANDKAKAEVVIDVELLQLNTSQLQDLGLSLNSNRVGVSLDTGSTGGEGGGANPLRLSDVEFLDANNWVLSIPNFLFDFIKTATEAQTLAKPQLRISEGERARLRIGSRVPVPVTQFNTANVANQGIVPVTSFQYQDVGILIEVEPRVHHNEEISLQLSVEVSNIEGSIDNQPIIGSRNIETTIRLKDGETNFLAGLIRTDETSEEDGIPGLSEIPILGRLFSKKRSQAQRTDIVLTMTPHIIRRADITEEDLAPIWVGTEANISVRGGSPRVESDVEGPFDGDESEDPQELIRRRLQQLPRGLQNQEQEEQEQEQPQGIDLVPAAPPSPFGLRRDRDDEDQEPPEDQVDLRRGQGTAVAGASRGRSLPWLRPTLYEGQPVTATLATTEARPSVSEPSVKVRLSPHGVALVPGDRLQVDLWVSSREPLAHLPTKLRFDPALLELVEVRQGPFLGTSDEAEMLATESEPGRLVVGASVLGDRPGRLGAGVLATLVLRAVAPGETRLVFEEIKALKPSLEEVSGEVQAEGAAIVISGDEPARLPQRPREREL